MKIQIAKEWEILNDKIDLANAEYERDTNFLPNEQMCDLLIVGEDHRFKYHPGVDPVGLCRAAWRTYACGSREGGSTIAMQLVRTVTGRYAKTIERKLCEIQLAYKLTKYLSRKRIPALYLWVAYYGWKMNNFTQACDRLGISPESATLFDAAKLVACLKYPKPKLISAARVQKIEKRSGYLVQRYKSLVQRPNIIEANHNTRLETNNGTFQGFGPAKEIH